MALRPTMLLVSSVMLVFILMLQPYEMDTAAVYPNIQGKRFDCRVFCKLTGYHGMIGGCRCSFTLFSSKRTDSLWQEGLLKKKEESSPSHRDSIEQNNSWREKRNVENDLSMDYTDNIDLQPYVTRSVNSVGEPNASFLSKEGTVFS